MTDIQQDLDEYQNIQRWLAGEQPPAAGRTWRRTMHDTIATALPAPVMSKIDSAVAMVPALPGSTLFHTGFGLLLCAITMPMIVSSMGSPTPLGSPMEGALLAFVPLIMPWMTGLSAVLTTVGSVLFLVNGA